MTIYSSMEKLANEIKRNGKRINQKNISKFLQEIENANRIFLTGAGRSGFAAKAFAMRMMHLGFKVHVVGESTTPAIEQGDLLVAITGSGKTKTIFDIVKAAKKKKAKIALVTHAKSSPIRKLSNAVIELSGKITTPKYTDYYVKQIMGADEKPIAPLGTLFELTAMVFLDAVTIELMKRNNRNEDQMKKLHTNLE